MKKPFENPPDIRDRTKEESMQILFRAEVHYLLARGWDRLVGTRDNRYYVAPGASGPYTDEMLHTHSQALQIQKVTDRWAEEGI